MTTNCGATIRRDALCGIHVGGGGGVVGVIVIVIAIVVVDVFFGDDDVDVIISINILFG